MQVITSTPTTFAPLQARWIPCSDRFVSVGSFQDGKGAITVTQIKQDLSCVNVRTIENSSAFRCVTMDVSPTCLRRLTTGQYDGSVSIWDLQHTQNSVWSASHTNLVNSVNASPGSSRPEFVSSSRDGCVYIWDTRMQGKPVISIQSDKNRTITSERSQPDPWVAKYGLLSLLPTNITSHTSIY